MHAIRLLAAASLLAPLRAASCGAVHCAEAATGSQFSVGALSYTTAVDDSAGGTAAPQSEKNGKTPSSLGNGQFGKLDGLSNFLITKTVGQQHSRPNIELIDLLLGNVGTSTETKSSTSPEDTAFDLDDTLQGVRRALGAFIFLAQHCAESEADAAPGQAALSHSDTWDYSQTTDSRAVLAPDSAEAFPLIKKRTCNDCLARVNTNGACCPPSVVADRKLDVQDAAAVDGQSEPERHNYTFDDFYSIKIRLLAEAGCDRLRTLHVRIEQAMSAQKCHLGLISERTEAAIAEQARLRAAHHSLIDDLKRELAIARNAVGTAATETAAEALKSSVARVMELVGALEGAERRIGLHAPVMAALQARGVSILGGIVEMYHAGDLIARLAQCLGDWMSASDSLVQVQTVFAHYERRHSLKRAEAALLRDRLSGADNRKSALSAKREARRTIVQSISYLAAIAEPDKPVTDAVTASCALEAAADALEKYSRHNAAVSETATNVSKAVARVSLADAEALCLAQILLLRGFFFE